MPRGLVVNNDSELRRLRWRCRRGTRELDRLLGHWLEASYLSAPPTSQQAFSRLLEHADPDLWDWLLGHGAPADKDEATLIDEIRTRHRV